MAANVLRRNRCTLLEFEGKPDHVHLLIDLHPDNNWSHLCGSVKSATSRIVGKEFASEIRPHIRKGLWGKQLYLRSASGAPLSKLQDYSIITATANFATLHQPAIVPRLAQLKTGIATLQKSS